jgi:hypothetical protein
MRTIRVEYQNGYPLAREDELNWPSVVVCAVSPLIRDEET